MRPAYQLDIRYALARFARCRAFWQALVGSSSERYLREIEMKQAGVKNQMTNSLFVKIAGIFLGLSILFVPVGAARAGESTMPPSFHEIIDPEMASKYVYTENGDYTKALGFPTYEWMPVGAPPKAMVLGIHGLTLHGRRFRVLARTFAVNGSGFVSMDMRGFGSCYFGDYQRFSTKDDDRHKVDYEKSYEDIVKLAQAIKQKYPDLRLIVLGESLGCTFCVRLAAEHPELVYGLAMSAPAIKLNHDMFAGHGQIFDGVAAALKPDHEIDLKGFFADLCSARADVQAEMQDDPYIRKELGIHALLSTDEVVGKTAKWGKSTDKRLAVLILQGSKDGCVSPKHVVDLMNNMPSDDQTLDWRGNFGHLQLETVYMQIPTIDAVSDWLQDHSAIREARLSEIQHEVAALGGTVSQ
jgi:alpha-beta hydrolase superfamily lysophospholipase